MVLDLLLLINFLFTVGYAGYLRKGKTKENPDQTELNGGQKTIIIITEFLNPVVAGAIYYYSLRKIAPIKAKQANKYSLVIFLIQILLGVAIVILSGPDVLSQSS